MANISGSSHSSDEVCSIDFGRSFFRFTSTRVNHSPRLHIGSSCTFVDADGARRQYFISSPYISEEMYKPQAIIHAPSCEAHFITATHDESLCLIKRYANARLDTKTAHRAGETMPTHDGAGSMIVSVEICATSHPTVTRVEDYEQFRAAHLANQPINGRTTYLDDDGNTRVVLEYPALTTNVAHGREAWQVDAGPLLLPVVAVAEVDSEVLRLDLAYMVFNRWDYGEIVTRCSTPLDENNPQGAATSFYGQHHALSCRHELFAAT